jgi:TctA family transporter
LAIDVDLSVLVVVDIELQFVVIALGMVIASIGYDPVTGGIRYAFGTMYLWEGIKIVPALVGLFAISEGIHLVVEDTGKNREKRSRFQKPGIGTFSKGSG